MFLSYAPSLSELVAGARGPERGGVIVRWGGARGDVLHGQRQLLSDGKTVL